MSLSADGKTLYMEAKELVRPTAADPGPECAADLGRRRQTERARGREAPRGRRVLSPDAKSVIVVSADARSVFDATSEIDRHNHPQGWYQSDAFTDGKQVATNPADSICLRSQTS